MAPTIGANADRTGRYDQRVHPARPHTGDRPAGSPSPDRVSGARRTVADMTAARRWWTVGVVVVLLVASPVLVRALPVADEDVSAAALLSRVQDSRDESLLRVRRDRPAPSSLPENEALSSLGELLGEHEPDAGVVARPRHLAGRDAAHDRRDRPGAPRRPDGALGLRVQAGHAHPGRPGAAAERPPTCCPTSWRDAACRGRGRPS